MILWCIRLYTHIEQLSGCSTLNQLEIISKQGQKVVHKNVS